MSSEVSSSLIPWVIGLVVIVVIFKFLDRIPGKTKERTGHVTYTPQNYGFLLTKAEFVFYTVLEEALKEDNVIIFTKVRLGDLVKAKGEGSNWGYGHNEINRKHVDFVICEKENAKVLFIIELDDASHNNEAAKKKDEFKNEVLEEADIPLLRYPVRQTYNVNMVREEIRRFFEENFKETG